MAFRLRAAFTRLRVWASWPAIGGEVHASPYLLMSVACDESQSG